MKGIQHGILLRKFNYSETSLILHFYTLENGFQAYLFQGGKKKKGNVLQALSMVEITAYRRPDSDLGKITEISSTFVPQNTPFNPVKSSLAFFIAEVLSLTLHNNGEDEKLYAFLEREIKWLDIATELTNYPIWFLLKLAEQVGIGINIEDKNGLFFDLQEGLISNQTPSSHLFVKDEIVPILKELLKFEKSELLAYHIPKRHRNHLTNLLIDYYRVHINGFKPLKSIEIIQEIFE